MSCQIRNLANTLELIPNGSPNFLTKAARKTWEKTEYDTSWMAEHDVSLAPTEKPRDCKRNQPPALLMNQKNTTKKLEEKKTPKRKTNAQANPHTKISTTIEWWNDLGTLSETPVSNHAHPVDDSHSRLKKKSKCVENLLPVPKTILGAWNRDLILVRLRSVGDADLEVMADDVSPFRDPAVVAKLTTNTRVLGR